MKIFIFILSITLLIMSIQNIFTVIPLILVLTINYTLFGFLYGFLWSWFSSIIAATFMFFGSRYFFQGWVVKKIKPEWLIKIEKNAFIFVFQARVMPFVPTSLINILGGVSPIKFKPFILGTILGNFIYFFILISIPAGILNANLNDYIVVSVILLAIVVYITLKNIIKRKKSQKKHRFEITHRNELSFNRANEKKPSSQLNDRWFCHLNNKKILFCQKVFCKIGFGFRIKCNSNPQCLKLIL